MTDPQEIITRFTRQVLPLEGTFAIVSQDEHFRDLAVQIVATTLPSREQSLALTALEEALMWANKAIAQHGTPQRVATVTALHPVEDDRTGEPEAAA